jgi:hypothetical protein
MWMAERQPRHERESQPTVSRRAPSTETWAAGSIHDGELVSKRDDFQMQAGA